MLDTLILRMFICNMRTHRHAGCINTSYVYLQYAYAQACWIHQYFVCLSTICVRTCMLNAFPSLRWIMGKSIERLCIHSYIHIVTLYACLGTYIRSQYIVVCTSARCSFSLHEVVLCTCHLINQLYTVFVILFHASFYKLHVESVFNGYD